MRQIISILLVFSLLHYTKSTYYEDTFSQQADEPSRISWLFTDVSLTAGAGVKRVQRSIIESRRELENDGLPRIINSKCRSKLSYLCGNLDKNNNDELTLLECIQTFKVFVNL